MTSPALAVDTPETCDADITLKSPRGYFVFHGDGDVFEVCEMNPDGFDVTGAVDREGRYRAICVDDGDGGVSGCDKNSLS